MIDPKKIDLNQLPKKFCDGAIGAYGKEIFTFAFTSGNTIDSYVSTPQMMKSIATWMNSQVEGYEKKYGEIAVAPPDIESPIQAADLKK